MALRTACRKLTPGRCCPVVQLQRELRADSGDRTEHRFRIGGAAQAFEPGVDTLEPLEVAAVAGQLERLPGISPRRAPAIRAALAQRLGRSRWLRPRAGAPAEPEPTAEMLLDVDREYRESARER